MLHLDYHPGILLPEMTSCLVLLQLKAPTILHSSSYNNILNAMIEMIDKYNKLAPGLYRDEYDETAWPGMWSKLAIGTHF